MMIKDLSAISWEFSGGFSKDIAEKAVLSAKTEGILVRTIPGKRDTWKVSLPEGVFYVRRVVNEGLFRPFLFKMSLSEWKTSTPMRRLSENVSAPAGTSMNS